MSASLSFIKVWLILLVHLENLLSTIVELLPVNLIKMLTFLRSREDKELNNNDVIQLIEAKDLMEICKYFNVPFQQFLIKTDDDYLLTIHRIPPVIKNSPIVYLHHGLLMCSDIWCCKLKREENLPFLLHDLGYDVWLGNNRGNKYSTNHLHWKPLHRRFWDFSIDEFAFFDIPNTIDFILNYCNKKKLICIGFSQGSAQTFASLSIKKDLNEKIEKFIAISPAMTPSGIHNKILDFFLKSSPNIVYYLFGYRVLLPSAKLWQRILKPSWFVFIIDKATKLLFNWKAKNISMKQKLICYSKLYSPTSVKCIVHWFQILKNQKFQLFEEMDVVWYKPYQTSIFPTKTSITIPMLIIFGEIDSLVNLSILLKNLPEKNIKTICIPNHEHLDLIWGRHVKELVFDKIINFIEAKDYEIFYDCK